MLGRTGGHCIPLIISWKSLFNKLFFISPEIGLRRWSSTSLFDAHQAFAESPEQNLASWAALITSLYREKRFEEVISLFRLIQRSGNGRWDSRPVMLSVLNSCAKLAALPEGRQIHSLAIKTNSVSDVVGRNVLISLYGKCCKLEDAVKVFDEMPERDLVSWSSVLSGLSQNGLAWEALEFSVDMHRQGVGFNDYGFCVVLKACIDLSSSYNGMSVHCLVIKTGFEDHVFVASSLVDMYGKCGDTQCARRAFDQMKEPNVVSWTSVIASYVQSDNGEEGLQLFREQMRVGMSPDPFSFSCILSACANLPALDQGKQIHAQVIKFGYAMQVFAGNSLIDMYSKCGCLADAKQVHVEMPIRNVVSWTGIISGYAHHGFGTEALHMFELMKEAEIKPNSVTFVCVLHACSHSGLIEEGMKHFNSMKKDFGVEPSEEHYTCMIDLLGRAGHVKDAEEFMKKMPFEPGASSWGALLNACRLTGDVGLGVRCAEQLFRLEPHVAANHVMLANMYAANRRWQDVARVRLLLKDKGIKKDSGYSWTEAAGNVHVFGVDDNMHPQSELIYSTLEHLYMELKDSGYAPDLTNSFS
ncbi:pentatricopeptide repeat-containing protein At5g04780, mitochondrial-like [Nymphaea colorata]|uniref:Pentacotripeptide-repeat region of PRORP domain-containing protein n=1 Tax=Nymphaea colorata TaxID=210225 RepID=A0A5K1ADI4_9MAGN|nr:pentatricopeptide repeat-containing protein At5g04780, mitochondrial-like [Nymphaea colorata]